MNEAKKEILVFALWVILLILFLSAYACSGGWEVCGYELDRL